MHIPNIKNGLAKLQLQINKIVDAVIEKVDECKNKMQTATDECKTQLHTKAEEACEYKAQLQAKATETMNKATETVHTVTTVAKLQEACF